MASVNLCHGLTGFVQFDDLSFTIEVDKNVPGALRHTARVLQDRSSASDGGRSDGGPSGGRSGSNIRWKRAEVLQGPPGNPNIIELFVVVDNSYVTRLGNNQSLIESKVLDTLNHVSLLFQPLNIYVALVGLQLWMSGDPPSITVESRGDLDQLLGEFQTYRKQQINPFYVNDNAQLITNKVFSRYGLGQAAGMCSYDSSVGVTSDDTGDIAVVAAQMAQAIGHNFGLTDDQSSCDCGSPECIMTRDFSRINPPTRWSDCSIERLDEVFKTQSANLCLQNIPLILEEVSCGNYFLDPGEECDCGPGESCANPCCDAATCRLRSGARCGAGDCCDLTTCDFKPRSTPCREAADDGSCDLPEFCSGVTNVCPEDAYKRDGTVCLSGEVSSYCYDGLCRSRDAQCAYLYGLGAQAAPDVCYESNENGDGTGHCGYLVTASGQRQYQRCRRENILCGKLQCDVPGQPSAASVRADLANYVVDQRSEPLEGTVCYSVEFELFGLLPAGRSLGVVPNGARCGEDRFCVNYNCVPAVAALPTAAACDVTRDCNGRGVCDSAGLCYCNAGFSPPSCIEPGQGGSTHSNPPPEDDPAPVALIVGLVVLFVAMAVIIGLVVWKRHELASALGRGRVVCSGCLASVPMRLSHKKDKLSSARDAESGRSCDPLSMTTSMAPSATASVQAPPTYYSDEGSDEFSDDSDSARHYENATIIAPMLSKETSQPDLPPTPKKPASVTHVKNGQMFPPPLPIKVSGESASPAHVAADTKPQKPQPVSRKPGGGNPHKQLPATKAHLRKPDTPTKPGQAGVEHEGEAMLPTATVRGHVEKTPVQMPKSASPVKVPVMPKPRPPATSAKPNQSKEEGDNSSKRRPCDLASSSSVPSILNESHSSVASPWAVKLKSTGSADILTSQSQRPTAPPASKKPMVPPSVTSKPGPTFSADAQGSKKLPVLPPPKK